VDIWLPPAQFYDPAAMAGERAAGRRTWLSVDRPPFSGTASSHASETDVRVIPWQARRLSAQAVSLGLVNDWPDDPPPATPDACVAHDPRTLLFPGGPFGLDEPVSSVRLKYLRRAAQDLAYARLMDEHGLQASVERIAASVSACAGTQAHRAHFADGRPPGWAKDVRVFELARQAMAAVLTSTAGSFSGADSAARCVAEQRLEQETDRPGLLFDGARVRLGPPTAASFEIQAYVSLTNFGLRELGGEMRFLDWPKHWSGRTVRPLELMVPALGTRRAIITATSSVRPAAPAGVLRVPADFIRDDGRIAGAGLRVAFVTAAFLRGPMQIDGDLSDWPPGAENVAGEFRLITPASSETKDLDRPRHETLAFVLRDAEFLYVAVNARHEGELAPASVGGNRVSYDDLIPIGEELVELLFDPFNSGTRSPADLFHIAVKPSGRHLVEKGIRMEPPCGGREPWPADIEVGTAVTDERWTVELRIPLKAFAAPASEHTVWGFNVTRFDASCQEFSTWSGAYGNAYDPISLGNLYLP
jgi:hypothetical protein